jgi:hypothetical protein
VGRDNYVFENDLPENPVGWDEALLEAKKWKPDDLLFTKRDSMARFLKQQAARLIPLQQATA